MNDHIPDATKMIQGTPRTDEFIGEYSEWSPAPRKNWPAFACILERELNAANSIIRQQQLLDEENLRLKDRIKRLEEMYEGKIGENEQFLGSNLQGLLTRELNAANDRIKRLDETLEAVTDKIDNAWGIYMEFKEPKL
jgi:hypothetical protein